MPRLEFRDVSITYQTNQKSGRGEVFAVKDVNLVVEPGQTLGIAGESGSGKSTLVMSVLRLLPKNAKISGEILLGDESVDDMTFGRLRAVRWTEAAIVFQGAMHSLNAVRKIGYQIEEPLVIHQDRDSDYRSPDARRKRVIELLKMVDIPASKAEAYPHELSGGQKQRVMIAMALACNPDLIIADEPTTALDVIVQEQVLSLLRDLVKTRQLSLIMISHDLSVLASTCERIIVMQNGQIVEEGIGHQVMLDPQHPHTRALASAFPMIGDWSSRLKLPTYSAPDAPDGPESIRPRRDNPVILEAKNVEVSFGSSKNPIPAVRGVSIECRQGEIVALVGQSGSGKTTLARTVLGLQKTTGGEVLFEGKPLPTKTRDLRAYRRRVQFVLQDPSAALNPKHSIYEAIAEGPRLHGLANEAEIVANALTRAELTPAESYFTAIPQELSGGQRQRVVIAGALALQPEFLVADEPVASLDASVRAGILALLLRLRCEENIGALVITHDLGLAWNIADRVIVMYQGEIVEEGAVEDVLLNPQHPYTQKLLAVVPTAEKVREAALMESEDLA